MQGWACEQARAWSTWLGTGKGAVWPFDGASCPYLIGHDGRSRRLVDRRGRHERLGDCRRLLRRRRLALLLLLLLLPRAAAADARGSCPCCCSVGLIAGRRKPARRVQA